jgi:putative membrane-bound dehydrogenase-like protein
MQRSLRLTILGLGFGILTAASASAQQRVPHGQDQPPGPALSPAEAIKKMTVPKGFSVELVASEPNIVNPVAMTFDERGRVWITESLEYPRSAPGAGRDRVKVLEDTDGDGRADKFTVFAEGLNIPSGIAVGHGGVWVANAPDILFLQDTDGDGKADKSEVVVTGFGRTDTHELPNSLTWGPDGWLYGLNGVFNYSDVKYRGKEYQFTCALFRIHPKTRDFELFAEGTSNPWGVAWNQEGSAFLSACVIDHLWHLTETGYYHRQGGPYPPFTWKIESIVKHKHQKAAYCGIHFFDSDAYPEAYRERLFMGNIHGNCINTDVLQRDGSTYFATPEPDFLSANDAWFMPVVQKTGPDGSLYVLDWYDQYHCYQDARRDPEGLDRLKGRLYRVRYQDTPRPKRFDLATEDDDQLIARLHSGNIYFRDVAQRILIERNQPGTRSKLEQLVFDEKTPRKTRMHALWSLVGGGILDPQFHAALLAHPDGGFRAWGVRAAGNQHLVEVPLREKIVSLARDPNRDVTLQVAIAARKLDGVEPLPVLLDVLTHCGDDKLIPHIVWQNLHPLLEEQSDQFLQLVGKIDLAAAPQLTALLPRVVERILGRRNPDPAPIVALFGMLSQGPQANLPAAQQCLATLAARVQTRELSGEHLEALKLRFEPILSKILGEKAENPLLLDAALLATTWKNPAGIERVRNVLTAPAQPEPRRLQAAGALIAAADPSVLDAVAAILAERQANSLEFRGKLLAALSRLDDPRVAEVTLAQYGKMEPELQPKVVELLTERIPWSQRLLAAIGKKSIPAESLNINQIRKLLATKNPELVKQVTATWGTLRDQRNPQRELVLADMRRFIRANPGDASAGQAVFAKVCGQCHKIYGEGQEVGPDITLNGRSSFEQLLSNVFDPSLVIGASYQARTVVTTKGQVFTGLVVEDGEQRIVLKVQGGKLETIPRDEVEETKVSELSIMPEGLEKQLQPQEMANLFAFLTLDKPPSDPAAKQLPGVRAVVPRETSDPAQAGDIIREVAPGFTTDALGEGGVALLTEHLGRTGVLRTHPLREGVPCVLRQTVELPRDRKSKLVLSVAHDPRGDWQLIVKANGQKLHDSIVGPKTTQGGWTEISIDLSKFAGQKVTLELLNQPNNWSWEFGYWGKAAIVSGD